MKKIILFLLIIATLTIKAEKAHKEIEIISQKNYKKTILFEVKSKHKTHTNKLTIIYHRKDKNNKHVIEFKETTKKEKRYLTFKGQKKKYHYTTSQTRFYCIKNEDNIYINNFLYKIKIEKDKIIFEKIKTINEPIIL